MSRDLTERVGASRIVHGPVSDRVYLVHLEPEDASRVVARMAALAEAHGYSKMFAKVPGAAMPAFEAAGFEAEAEIPRFFGSGDRVVFASRFLDAARRAPADPEGLEAVLAAARAKAGAGAAREAPKGYRLAALGPADAEAMAALYGAVFETYPFPISDPAYLRETMQGDFRYFGAWHGDHLVAQACCEIDGDGVEMTDFATDPEHRAAGLGGLLLELMQASMREAGLRTAFTIARGPSFGINILFSRAGYTFAGALVNNTGISGSVETMNVWYRPL